MNFECWISYLKYRIVDIMGKVTFIRWQYLKVNMCKKSTIVLEIGQVCNTGNCVLTLNLFYVFCFISILLSQSLWTGAQLGK